jgi:hypothetical protein
MMGQKSAIDRLPESLRNKLLEMLHNPAVTQLEIVDAINDEAGESLVSKSSLNRYAQRMKRFSEKSRQAREVADAYIDKYGATDRNKLGKVVNEQIRLAVFDLIGEIEEIKDDPKMNALGITEILYKLSRGLRELEQAEKLNADRTEEIKKSVLAEAVEVVEKEAKSAGLDEAALNIIKRKILGL